MSDLKQALRDFVTTSNSGKYATEEELMSKFPELQGYDIQVLRDFVTTSNSGKYADEETLFSKFPEFGIGQQPKKKEDGGLLQEAQRTIQQYSQSLSPSQESESQQLSPSVSSLVEPYKEQKVKKLSPVGTTPVDTTAIDYTTIQEDLSWQDKIGVGGSQSSINQNKIESEEKAKELAILEEKRRKKEAADDITRAREMFARRAEEEKIRLENEKLNLDYRTKDLNFLSNLNSVTSDLISTTKENVVQKLNEKFKGNGIVFEEAGWGTNRIIARTEDGKSVINIGSYNFLDSANTSEAEKLRNFISKNAKRTEDIGDRDFLSNSLKAQNLRAVPMIENGEPSTVRFTSFEENGKFLVIPTLFPKDPNKYTTNPSTWMELPFEQARKVAMERGEVFTFKTQKEADDFAKGSWKDVNTIDIEGDSFFKALGKDYMTEKKRYERFTELDDIIDFAEKVYKYEGTSMTEQELQKKYPKYFISGKARFDLEKMLPEMKKERDALKPLVKDYTFFNQEGTSEDARMMWDKYLQDRNNQISSQAAAVRRDADIQEMNLDKKSYEKFGVSIKDLKNYAVTNPSQKKEYDQLINQYVDAQDKKVIASEYMQEAKLYFDAKDNKNIMQEFSENFSGVVNSTLDAYRENAGGAALLNFAIGLKNAHKIKDVKEASEYIKNLRESMSGTQSKELTRFQNVSDFSELIDVISDDPISVITSLVGSSFATQLPVGTKIIPATVLTSTVYGGATAGLPGAVGGFFSGLSTGQAITEFATEYNTALIDAIKKRGYDMEDPYSLQKALLNKEVWDEALEIGVTRGIPMAIMEKVTGGLSGRVFVPSSRLATTASKLKGYALESAVIDPTSEMLGELAAQGAMVATGKQDKIQYTELYGEFLGGLGAKSMTNGASTLYKIVRDHNNINLAYDLTDVANIAKENVSDERIMSWADNMVRLGKIDNTVAHRIRENVGLKREAKELMSVGEKPSNEVVARTMELMAAKQELTKTKNRSEVYRDKISEIDEELANMASTKKVADKDNQTSLVGITEAVRPSVAEYTINNRRYTKERFLDKINSMSPGRISRNDVKVVGDEEIVNLLNKKTNAVQEQTAGQVSVQPTTGVSQEVAQGESQAEPQVATGQGVTEEKPKEKISVYRGIGNNVMGSDNSSTLWVAEDKEVAKNYAGTLEDGTLNVQSLEVEKPSNPIEMPYKLATDVRGSDIANNLRSIVAKLKKSGELPKENISKVLELISDFESKAGDNLELFTAKLNKTEANEAFSKAVQALGFDGIIQKESAARGGEMTNTYGIFKNKYSSLLQPTSETKVVDATPTIAEVAPTERTPEQEADLLEELVSGKKKDPTVTEVKAEPTSKEAIAKRLRGKKNKGLMSSIDFGISQALYNGALEFMASQVEKGTKLGNAIENTIKWIDERMQGNSWDKDGFTKYANTTFEEVATKKKAKDILDAYPKGSVVGIADLASESGDTIISNVLSKMKDVFNKVKISGRRPTEGAAFYNYNTKEIDVNKNSPHWDEVEGDQIASALSHEFSHHLIDGHPEREAIETDLQEIKDDLIANKPELTESQKKVYEFMTSKNNSPQEILTYAVSDPDIRPILTKYKDKLNNISNKLFGEDVISGIFEEQKTKKDEIQSQRTRDGRGRTESRAIAPLEGAPSVPGFSGPDPQLTAVAEEYAKENGIPYKRQGEYVKVDEGRAKRIAQAYEEMKHDPQNPKVKEAYENLIKQTIAQYEALVKAGYKFWFIDTNIPSNLKYAESPYNAMRDIRNNKEMGVFPTTDGFGSSDIDVSDNPLMAETKFKWPVGGMDGELKPVLANDLFRAVHDAFGHGLEGAGFRARGEENAWQAHIRLFTGSAIGAITSETRGQNS